MNYCIGNDTSWKRTNAWMDSYMTVLNRFDTLSETGNHGELILLFSVMPLRKCFKEKKSPNYFRKKF